MKRLIVFLLVLTGFAANSFAQNLRLSPVVIPTQGKQTKVGNFALSWTVGELLNRTTRNGNLVLSEGFQQADEVKAEIGIDISNCGANGYFISGAGIDTLINEDTIIFIKVNRPYHRDSIMISSIEFPGEDIWFDITSQLKPINVRTKEDTVVNNLDTSTFEVVNNKLYLCSSSSTDTLPFRVNLKYGMLLNPNDPVYNKLSFRFFAAINSAHLVIKDMGGGNIYDATYPEVLEWNAIVSGLIATGSFKYELTLNSIFYSGDFIIDYEQ